MIIRRQGDGDQYGDERNDHMVRAQAEERRAWLSHGKSHFSLSMIFSENRLPLFGIML
jgi:hypothetical protein